MTSESLLSMMAAPTRSEAQRACPIEEGFYCFCLNPEVVNLKKKNKMKESTKRTWKRVFDIIVTILTALITALTTQSCIGALR